MIGNGDRVDGMYILDVNKLNLCIQVLLRKILLQHMLTKSQFLLGIIGLVTCLLKDLTCLNNNWIVIFQFVIKTFATYVLWLNRNVCLLSLLIIWHLLHLTSFIVILGVLFVYLHIQDIDSFLQLWMIVQDLPGFFCLNISLRRLLLSSFSLPWLQLNLTGKWNVLELIMPKSWLSLIFWIFMEFYISFHVLIDLSKMQ